MKQTVSSEDFWAFLDQNHQVMVQPKDSFTIPDYMKRYNVTYSVAKGIVKRLEQENKITCVGKFGPNRTRAFILNPESTKR